MSIGVVCPNCGSRMRFLEKLAGRSAKCSECGTVLRIPSLEQSDEPPVLEEDYYQKELIRQLVQCNKNIKRLSYHLGCLVLIFLLPILGVIFLLCTGSTRLNRDSEKTFDDVRQKIGAAGS